MAIVPDDKDWTWVLDRPCPECGFDAAAVERADVAALVRRNAAQWPELMSQPTVRERPSPHEWSALEYGCHVRDVHTLFARRLELMLSEDDPVFENWDQDATAVEEGYDRQEPAEVVTALLDAAEEHARRWETVGDDDWERPGRRSNGSVFTVDSFARYMLHDPIHHAADVARNNARLS